MKKIKTIALVLVALLAILLPIVSVVTFAVCLPPQYSDTFVGVLDEKYDRLHSIDEPKIVIVGGSSVAFGIDSEKLEEYTGMPVVNFGLYAALGTKVMLDLSDSGINEGDIVILSPEMDPQTMSLYFSSETTLKAIDDDYSMFWDIDVNNWFNMLGGMWKLAGDKYGRYLDSLEESEGKESDEIYQSKYFDEYGDFDYVRPENTMAVWYDVNTPINLDVDKVEKSFYEFADYLNDYIRKCERRGATVYYSYPPMNELAITSNSYEDGNMAEFCSFLEDSINCEFITDLDDAIMEAGYFFDTNFHLNDAGVDVRTIRLAKDIRLAYGITQGVITDTEPEAPALPGADLIYDGEDENAAYFEFELDEAGFYSISGLSELGMAATELTVPLGYDGLKVMSIRQGAFAGSSLEKLVITADSNLIRIENGAFEGASSLSELWIYKKAGNDINPPNDFSGTDTDFTVHVPADSDFDSHYYWSERGLTYVKDAEEQ